MQFTKLSSPSLKDLFVNQLQSAIIAGDLKIGEQLPPERTLAEEMQVSRAVVNSGLLELEARGFIEMIPRQGNYVADYKRYGNAETLNAIMEYNGGVLAHDTIESILEIRIALEHVAVEKVIETGTSQDFEVLGKILSELVDARSNLQASEKAFEFWHELTFRSGNTIIPLIYSSFRHPILTLWQRYCRTYGVEALIENTTTLYNYICKKDLEGVTAWIDLYLGRIKDGDRGIYEEYSRKKKTIPMNTTIDTEIQQ